MQTIYDWLTVAVFAGLIVLFLQRSSVEHPPRDNIWQYLLAAIGCAVVNYVGNDDNGQIGETLGSTGQHLLAVALLAMVLAYAWYVLKPFERSDRSH